MQYLTFDGRLMNRVNASTLPKLNNKYIASIVARRSFTVAASIPRPNSIES